MPELNYKTFVPMLLGNVPELQSVYDQHLLDNEKLLPHVFMGDVTRFVIEIYRQSETRSAPRDIMRRVLGDLEKAIASSDSELQELVSASFLENLHQADDTYEGIKKLLGPGLRKELAITES